MVKVFGDYKHHYDQRVLQSCCREQKQTSTPPQTQLMQLVTHTSSRSVPYQHHETCWAVNGLVPMLMVLGVKKIGREELLSRCCYHSHYQRRCCNYCWCCNVRLGGVFEMRRGPLLEVYW